MNIRYNDILRGEGGFFLRGSFIAITDDTLIRAIWTFICEINFLKKYLTKLEICGKFIKIVLNTISSFNLAGKEVDLLRPEVTLNGDYIDR